MATGAGAAELRPNIRAMKHFGRSPAESEKSDQNTVGQLSERRAGTHTRDNTVSLPPLFVSKSSLYTREYGESAGNDIRENRRRSEWNTGDHGMGSAVGTIEGQ